MRFQTTRELLDKTRQFHIEASEYLRRLSQAKDQKRVMMLLDYLARHEQKLAENVEHFEEDARPSLLNAWFDEAPEISLEEALESLKLHDGLDVIRLGMHLGDYLIWAFEYLAEQAESEEVRDAFTNLAGMAQADKRILVRDSNMLQDF